MRLVELIPVTTCIFFCTALITQNNDSLVNGFSIESKSLTKKTSTFISRNNEKGYHQINSALTSTYDTSSPSYVELSAGATDDDTTSPSSKQSLIRELIAEFIGTFIIVQLGCGTVCAAVFKSAQVGLWQIAVSWAIAVTLGICTTATVSGAHLNPSITISLALLRGFSWLKVPTYIIAQVLGAVSAAGLNYVLFADSITAFETSNNIVRGTLGSIQSASAFGEYWSASTKVSTAFLTEAYGTAMLAFVIFALTNSKNETTSKHPFLIPPMIGLCVAGLISVIAPITQCGLNPARDFGPRIITMLTGWGSSIAMKGWWLYVIAPIVGAPIGAFIADKVLYADK